MNRHWIMGAILLAVSAGNLGCYYDQWVEADRANGVLREDLTRTKEDLQDCEMMSLDKDRTIGSLRNEITTKDEMISQLTGEAQNWRDAFDKAQATLEEMMGKGPGKTVVVSPKLPQSLHEKLKALADAYPDLIAYDEKKGAVRWKADLLFPLGSDQLSASPEVMESLKEFAGIVNSDDGSGFDVIVVGHTCTTPIRRAATLAEHKTNWHLSAHRAISVMNIMAERKVATTRMGVMGYGEYRPIADNSSKEGKARNRRVEIYLVSRDAVQSVSRGVLRVEGMDLVFLPASAR